MPSYIGRCGRILQNVIAANEVDFAQILICELQDVRAGLITIGSSVEIDSLRLGIQERQILRIVQKQIDVVALAMIDLQHESSPAAKAPLGRKAIFFAEMLQDADGEIEEDRPFTWPLFGHGVRPPAAMRNRKAGRPALRLGSLAAHPHSWPT